MRDCRWVRLILMVCVVTAAGCESGPDAGGRDRSVVGESGWAEPPRPNIVCVVWDTVRADRMSLYGHRTPTTPHLDEWARQARVYEDCVSVSSTTVPSHASIFTGLLPTEHGLSNDSATLHEGFETLGELLKKAGYNTYLFAENPYISKQNKYSQGFDATESPIDPKYLGRAWRIALERVPHYDRSTNLAELLRRGPTREAPWHVLWAGKLIQEGVTEWLSEQERDRPVFIFLNYMAAHYPLTPPRRFRERIMTPRQVKDSYRVDRKLDRYWDHVFRLQDYTEHELELTRATYDAALVELDDLLHNLLESLDAGGHLENTVVILTSDHGEHLGEHHLLGHVYSVYEQLLRVPLVLYYPAYVTPGRDRRPVTNMDIYPTVLELAGMTPPIRSKAISLLHPREERVRVGEYLAVDRGTFYRVRRRHHGFDASPWNRRLRAYYDPPYKLIEASDRRHELYNLAVDPDERRNLFPQEPQIARRMNQALQDYLGSLLEIRMGRRTKASPVDEVQRRRLQALGYLGGEEEEEKEVPAESN